LSTGFVDVTTQVVAFARRRKGSGELLGEEPLDLPPRTLRTASVWWTLSAEQVERSGVPVIDLPGAAHAAEHASIGLLPLLATCDRGDLGGLSTVMHPDTGRLTVFVHDAVPGGAGFAERGFLTARTWLSMTRTAISECGCSTGCPSCVQSPKCGNGNEPLNKAGAIALLDVLLAGTPDDDALPD
jgi:DEAD/DEAH box helicase domain-containing protein